MANAAPTPAPNVVRFGLFEVDPRTGELRKNGIKLKFSGQPFQVLTILLARPGDIVTRKQHMQLSSKMRFLAAQFIALLDDDLWLQNARHANAMASRLAPSLPRLLCWCDIWAAAGCLGARAALSQLIRAGPAPACAHSHHF